MVAVAVGVSLEDINIVSAATLRALKARNVFAASIVYLIGAHAYGVNKDKVEEVRWRGSEPGATRVAVES